MTNKYDVYLTSSISLQMWFPQSSICKIVMLSKFETYVVLTFLGSSCERQNVLDLKLFFARHVYYRINLRSTYNIKCSKD